LKHVTEFVISKYVVEFDGHFGCYCRTTG